MDAAELLGLNRPTVDPLTELRRATTLANGTGVRVDGSTASGRPVELAVEGVDDGVLRIRFRPKAGDVAASPPHPVLRPLDLMEGNPSSSSSPPSPPSSPSPPSPSAPSPSSADGDGVAAGVRVELDLHAHPDDSGTTPPASLVSGPLRVHLTRDPVQLQIEEAATGRILLQSSAADSDVMLRPRVAGFGFRERGEALLAGMGLALTPDERFAGLGERFGPLNLRGQRVQLLNLDAMGVGADAAYKNVPFVVSSRGYGLFWNTYARMQHDVGYPQTSLYSYAVESEEPELDLWFLYGPTPAEILRRYTALTGRTEAPPAWSFGLWMSRCWYDTQDEASEVVDRLEAERIPCDVLTLDGRAWLNLRTRCDFQFDRTRYPHPEQLIRRLAGLGVKVCLWEYPYLSVESPLFEEAAARGYLLRDTSGNPYVVHFPEDAFNEKLTAFPDSAFVDFTNPEAVAWYQELHRPLFEMGVAVFKTDFGEQVPPDAIASTGLYGSELHNAYATLYNQAVYEATGRFTGEPVVWARSGWAGSQRHPIHWAGDPPATWGGLAASIRGGLALSMSGFSSWSHDIGGFYGEAPSPELYIRWSQFGLLSPFARCHGTTPREPWFFGEEATEIFRRYVELRYRLLPYLVAAAHESGRTGLPMMRPMLLEAPEEGTAWSADLQYLLGPDLLVAPLTAPGGRRRVYLPSGTWINYWTHEVREGSGEIEIQAPLDEIPMFVRGESLIPLGPGAVGVHIPHVGAETLIITQLDYFADPGRETGEAQTEVWGSDGPIRFHIRREESDLSLSQTGTTPYDLRLYCHHGGNSVPFRLRIPPYGQPTRAKIPSR